MKLLNEILGTRYPIIQGGMANIATGEFAAACSNAGALGIIGAGGMNADTLRENIRRCKQLTTKPFGVNIMLMHPQADEFAKIVVEEGVQVVTTGAGNPGKYVPMWKAAGIKVIPVVAAAVLAKHLEPLGIDAVIAEGTESGGHVGTDMPFQDHFFVSICKNIITFTILVCTFHASKTTVRIISVSRHHKTRKGIMSHTKETG